MNRSFHIFSFLAVASFIFLAGCGGPGSNPGLFAKKANQGSLTLSQGEAHLGASPVVRHQNIPLGSTNNVVLFQLKVEASAVEDINLTTLVFQATGTGHDVNDLDSTLPVSLYLDVDEDGVLDSPGDTLVDQGSFTADNGQITMTLNHNVSSGTADYFLLVYDFDTSGSAAGGQNFVPAIDAATDVTATGLVTGITPLLNGGVVNGAEAEIVGSVILDEGLQNPLAASISSYATGVVMLQMNMDVDSAENLTLNSVTVTASGTGNEATDIQGVALYLDMNNNGAYDPALDTPLGTSQDFTTAGDDGSLTFSGIGVTLSGGTQPDLIVVYDFNTSTGGLTYKVDVSVDADVTATGAGSSESPFITGAPVLGNLMTTIQTGILMVTAGTNNPTTNTYVTEGTAGNVLTQVNLDADSYENIDIVSITFTHAGSGVIASDVATYSLHNDVDGSGTLNAGDTPIAGTVTLGTNTITFSGLSETILQNDDEDWILVCDFASGLTNSGGHTFSASISSNADITAQGQTSFPLGASIVPAATPAFPIGGAQPAFTLLETLTLSLGPNDPGAQGYTPTATTVVVQFQLDATCGPVNVTSLTLTPSGTGDDNADLTSLNVHVESAGTINGVVDVGETQIATGVYTADETARTYSLTGQTVTPGTSTYWIVEYTISGGSPGETFRVEVNQASDLSASGQGSAQTLTPLGTYPVQGGTVTYTTTTLTVSASTQNPSTNGSVSRSTANVLMLGLNLAASAAGAVNVTGVTVTASGMGHDANHITSVALYHDTNNDGVGDAQLGSNATYSADDGTATFTFSTPYPQITAGGNQNWIVVYNFNTANVWVGCTFRAGVAQNSDISTQSSTVTGVGTGINGAYRAIQGIWNQITTTGATLPTGGHAIHHATYDANADSMIIFGGVWYDSINLNYVLHPNRTYELTLTGGTETWANINGGTGASDPPTTAGGIFQYYTSGTNQYIVLTSGYINGATTYTTNTYIFDLTSNNNTWSQPTITGTPPQGMTGMGGRIGMTGVVDTSGTTPRLVTFGGYSYDSVNLISTFYNDVSFLSLGTTKAWTASGTITGTAPGARSYAGMVFDPSQTTARALIVGGQQSGGASATDARTLSLGTTLGWGSLTTPTVYRDRPSAVYDPVVEQMIVFGGENASHTVTNSIEVWELSSGTTDWRWSQTWTTGAPSARCWHTAVWDQNSNRMIVFGGFSGTASNSEVWELY